MVIMNAPEYTPPVNEGLEILYEDDYLLAVNKPSGLLSVPGRGPDKQDCLVSRVAVDYPGILVVHRLDMATSGVVVMALNKAVQAQLGKLFSQREVNKRYLAVVEGIMLDDNGTVDQPMICDWPNRPRQKIDHEQGKPATTQYRVLDRDDVNMTTRVELVPITGRTHQLRLHMQFIGHTILGDRLYAGEEALSKSGRLLLHATELSFKHPVTGKVLQVFSQPPF